MPEILAIVAASIVSVVALLTMLIGVLVDVPLPDGPRESAARRAIQPTNEAERAPAGSAEPRRSATPTAASSPPPATPSPGPTPAPSPEAPSPAPLAPPPGVPAGAQAAVVERIVDGDTIWARVDQPGSGPLVAAATHKIRLLEYDSPEATSDVQCGGPEATAAITALIPPGTALWLEADREDTDRFGRFLRYVYTADGMVNVAMVEAGWGVAVLYPPNDAHINEIREAEAIARASGVGLWGPPCELAAAPPAPAPPADAPAPPPEPPAPAEPEPESEPVGACDPSYPDVCIPPIAQAGDLDCGDVAYRRFTVLPPDPHGFDGDSDGVGCE